MPPQGNEAGKIPVSLAFRILNLSNIDEVDQHFNVVGYLVAEWEDSRLAYKQQGSRDEYRTYKKEDVWVPEFDFSNGVTPHQSHDSTIRVYPDGSVKYFERSSADLSSNLYLYKFPFDTQKLRIRIQPFVGQQETVVFSVAPASHLNEFGADQPLSSQDGAFSSLVQWRIIGTSSTVEMVRGLGNEEATLVNFEVEVKRLTAFYLLKVFWPLIMMVILSWMAFWIDPKELNSQVNITVTIILTVIAFSFAIASNLPKVPYLTFIDAFILACYIFVFSTTLIVTRIHVLKCRSLEGPERWLQRSSQIFYPILFVIIVMILVLNFAIITW